MEKIYLVRRTEQYEPSLTLWAFADKTLAEKTCEILNRIKNHSGELCYYGVKEMDVLTKLPVGENGNELP